MQPLPIDSDARFGSSRRSSDVSFEKAPLAIDSEMRDGRLLSSSLCVVKNDDAPSSRVCNAAKSAITHSLLQ